MILWDLTVLYLDDTSTKILWHNGSLKIYFHGLLESTRSRYLLGWFYYLVPSEMISPCTQLAIYSYDVIKTIWWSSFYSYFTSRISIANNYGPYYSIFMHWALIETVYIIIYVRRILHNICTTSWTRKNNKLLPCSWIQGTLILDTSCQWSQYIPSSAQQKNTDFPFYSSSTVVLLN